MNKEDNETLKYFKKVYDELMQDEKYQKYSSVLKYYHERIIDLKNQLKEKDKIIEEKNKCLLEIAKEEINFINYLKSKGMNFDDESWVNELEEILERGKNANSK